MAAPARHSAVWEQNVFCARVPCIAEGGGGSCVAGSAKNYIEVCEPAWAAFTFPRGKKKKQKKYEAHHILCFACVTSTFFLKENGKYKLLARGTKWCVNNQDNMIALPMWGHTLKFYEANLPTPPPFANLPQHDIDHNITEGYTDEVKSALKKLLRDLKKQKHDIEKDDISGQLNTLSGNFRTTLRVRGSTRGPQGHIGTDAAFRHGKGEWYAPFSMAAEPRPRTFSSRSFPQALADAIARA